MKSKLKVGDRVKVIKKGSYYLRLFGTVAAGGNERACIRLNHNKDEIWMDVSDLKKVRRSVKFKQIKSGKKKGQWYFSLYGDNGKNVGNSLPETYKTTTSALKTVREYFPDFIGEGK